MKDQDRPENLVDQKRQELLLQIKQSIHQLEWSCREDEQSLRCETQIGEHIITITKAPSPELEKLFDYRLIVSTGIVSNIKESCSEALFSEVLKVASPFNRDCAIRNDVKSVAIDPLNLLTEIEGVASDAVRMIQPALGFSVCYAVQGDLPGGKEVIAMGSYTQSEKYQAELIISDCYKRIPEELSKKIFLALDKKYRSSFNKTRLKVGSL